MHETYRILVESRIDERIHEADAWRLAHEGRRVSRGPGLVARIRVLYTRLSDQRRVPAATGQALVEASCRP